MDLRKHLKFNALLFSGPPVKFADITVPTVIEFIKVYSLELFIELTLIVLLLPDVQYIGLAFTVIVALPVPEPFLIVIVLLSSPIEAVAILLSEEDTSNLLELSFPVIDIESDVVPLEYTLLYVLDNLIDDAKLLSGALFSNNVTLFSSDVILFFTLVVSSEH